MFNNFIYKFFPWYLSPVALFVCVQLQNSSTKNIEKDCQKYGDMYFGGGGDVVQKKKTVKFWNWGFRCFLVKPGHKMPMFVFFVGLLGERTDCDGVDVGYRGLPYFFVCRIFFARTAPAPPAGPGTHPCLWGRVQPRLGIQPDNQTQRRPPEVAGGEASFIDGERFWKRLVAACFFWRFFSHMVPRATGAGGKSGPSCF